MHLIVTKVNEVRYRNYASLSFDFADRKGGWREDLHRLTLYTLRLPSAVADAIYAPAAVKTIILRRQKRYQGVQPDFRQKDSDRR